VGIGLGTTFHKLEELGYAVTGITPDLPQIEEARKRTGKEAHILPVRFEDLTSESGPYDLILMQESAQHINPLDLVNQACDLLADGGELFILDEVILHSTGTGSENLPFLKHFLAIAERCCFELVEHIDLSAKAAPTLDYLLSTVKKHKDEIKRELALSEDAFTSLMVSSQAYKQRYTDGIYGYVLLRFKKGKSLRWRVHRLTDSDVPDVLRLFKAVFGQEMAPETWRWKYGEHRGQAMIARRKGEIVAHYGGVSRPVLFFGKQKPFWQICDVMVLPSERGIFSRKGPFFLTAASFTEIYGSTYCGQGFGFPNKRAMKVAEKLGLYGGVGHMVEIRWSRLSDRPRLRSRIRHLDPSVDVCHVNTLWEEMSRDFQNDLIGFRDWSYVEHRYLSHPTKCYDAFLVWSRFKSSPMGVMVLNRNDERLELVDIIGSLSNLPFLIVQARRLAGRWKFDELYCWITKTFSKTFTHTAGVEFPTEIVIPTTIWSDGPDPEEIRGKWWLMAGDTDFH